MKAKYIGFKYPGQHDPYLYDKRGKSNGHMKVGEIYEVERAYGQIGNRISSNGEGFKVIGRSRHFIVAENEMEVVGLSDGTRVRLINDKSIVAANVGATGVVDSSVPYSGGDYLSVRWDRSNPKWNGQRDGGYNHEDFEVISSDNAVIKAGTRLRLKATGFTAKPGSEAVLAEDYKASDRYCYVEWTKVLPTSVRQSNGGYFFDNFEVVEDITVTVGDKVSVDMTGTVKDTTDTHVLIGTSWVPRRAVSVIQHYKTYAVGDVVKHREKEYEILDILQGNRFLSKRVGSKSDYKIINKKEIFQ